MTKSAPFLFLLLSFELFLSSCSSSTNSVPPPHISTQEAMVEAGTLNCQGFAKRLDLDFANKPNAFYDFVEVPENPGDPASQIIKVFYYGRLVPGQTPIVFFNGGPAADSHSSYLLLTRLQQMDDKWASLPFIFFDQRGRDFEYGFLCFIAV